VPLSVSGPDDAETARLECEERQEGNGRRSEEVTYMALLWLLIILLIIFALVGGVAVNSWLFLIVVIALVLALVGYF